MLTGKEIINRMKMGDIVINPFDDKRVNPNSYDLTLNNKLLIYDNVLLKEEVSKRLRFENMDKETVNNLEIGERVYYDIIMNRNILNMKSDNPTTELIIPEDGLLLMPGKLYLGKTNEYTETYNLVPGIDGRSSVGRLGINIHATAGFGDIGFKGNWTLEISVIEPIAIYPNIPLCQIYYYIPTGEIENYNGRYQDSHDVYASRLFKDYK